MSFIAFVDMVGTRAAGMISNDEYTASINDFTDALKQFSVFYNCRIYGYTDNAYLEFFESTDLIQFLQSFREHLLYQHRYFSAAATSGSLEAQQIKFGKPKGFSMKFTSPVATDLYINQRNFSGIGVSLSDSIVRDLHMNKMDNMVCKSVYHCCSSSGEDLGFEEVLDLAYTPVSLEQLKYIFADYIMATATSIRAGRYYLTPIISMIKCLNPSVVLNQLEELVNLLSFNATPPGFKLLNNIDVYSLYFTLALVDSVIAMREQNPTIDAIKICEYIIRHYDNPELPLITSLPSILESIISCGHKRELLRIMYNMKSDNTSSRNEPNERT